MKILPHNKFEYTSNQPEYPRICGIIAGWDEEIITPAVEGHYENAEWIEPIPAVINRIPVYKQGVIDVDEKKLKKVGKYDEYCFDDLLLSIVDNVLTDKDLDERQERVNKNRIAKLKLELAPLQEDIVQDIAGQVVPNIENKKAEFRRIHNEIRVLEGKLPREEA